MSSRSLQYEAVKTLTFKIQEMKKRILLLSLAASMSALALMSYSSGPGNSGLGDLTSTGCVNCHGPNSTNTKISLGLIDDATSTPVTTSEYVPGKTYRIVELGSNAAGTQTHFGFQVMAVNGAGNQAGSFTIVNSANTQTFTGGGLTGAENKTPIAKSGNTCNPQIKWTAPAAGTGAITFRIALNVVNNNNNTASDQPNVGTIALQEKPAAFVAGITVSGMRLFPNPSRGNMTLDLGNAPEGRYTLTAVDMNGKMTVLGELRSSGKSKLLDIPVAGLPAGVYHLVISGPQGVQTLKFIRQ